jgi:hypothetical protein
VRSALRQVVGAFVRADSKVVDDKLVQDRIISHSQGFIERVTKKGPARLKDGQYQQEAVVLVRRGKVGEVLAEPASSSSSVDGSSLAAKVRMLKEQKASASELMKVVFEDFPACVLDCEVAPECALDQLKPSKPPDGFRVTIANDDVFLLVKVDIWVNERKWKAWADAAEQAFKAVSLAEFSSKLTPRKCGAQRVARSTRVGEAWIAWAPWMSEAAAKAEHLSWPKGHGQNSWLGPLTEELKARLVTKRSGGQSSLKDNMPVRLDAVPVALASSDRASTMQCFLISRESFSFEASVPEIVIELLDAGDGSLGTPIPLWQFSYHRAKAPEGTMLPVLYRDNRNQAPDVLAAPLWPNGIAPNAEWPLVLYPRLTCTPDFQSPLLLGRCTIPIGFVLPESQVSTLARIDARLGEPISLLRR